jgi:hypothetical protein
MRAGVGEAGARQSCQAVVVERGQRAQDPGEIARSTEAGRVGALDQGDRPAAGGQPFGSAAAGQAGTDDDRVAASVRRWQR